MTKSQGTSKAGEKKIFMFRNGEWVDWDKSDVDRLLITEQLTVSEVKKHYPDYYNKGIHESKTT